MVKLRVLGEAYTPNKLPFVHFVANTTLSASGAFLLRSACCILEQGLKALVVLFVPVGSKLRVSVELTVGFEKIVGGSVLLITVWLV